MISAVILSKNEEGNIRDCIRSLGFADEILVIDDRSSDDTCEVAKAAGAKVISHSLEGDWAKQRNFALTSAKGDWVLFIDADERVPEKLAEEIKEAVKGPENITGYYFKRHDKIWGKTITSGEIGSVKLLRFAKRNTGKWKRCVHEVWVVAGETRIFDTPLIHLPHQSLGEFVNDINLMSSLHARANLDEGKRSSIVKIIFMPMAHFVRNYLLRRGFRDGVQGIVVALIMSFHSYLSWSKLWIMQEQKHSI